MSSKNLRKEFFHAGLRVQTEALLEVIWAAADVTFPDDRGFEELSKASMLCKATLYRLWGGTYIRPQFLTIQKLAHAVGLDIKFQADGFVAVDWANASKSKNYA